jgi:hypothetical protein
MTPGEAELTRQLEVALSALSGIEASRRENAVAASEVGSDVTVRRTPWFPTRTEPGDGEGCMTTNALADGVINPRSIKWSASSGLQGSASMSSPKMSECIR